MTPEQLTPMGILAVLVAGCVWGGKWLLTRLAKTFDAQDEAMKSINVSLQNVSRIIGSLAEHAAREDQLLSAHTTELRDVRREVAEVKAHVTGEVEKVAEGVEGAEERLVSIVVLAVKKAAETQPITLDDLPVRHRR